MDSMMDAIKSCNPIKIQQLFENEHVGAYNVITSYPQGHGIIQTIAVSRCFDCQQPVRLIIWY
jgi:hypothetical protein